MKLIRLGDLLALFLLFVSAPESAAARLQPRQHDLHSSVQLNYHGDFIHRRRTCCGEPRWTRCPLQLWNGRSPGVVRGEPLWLSGGASWDLTERRKLGCKRNLKRHCPAAFFLSFTPGFNRDHPESWPLKWCAGWSSGCCCRYVSQLVSFPFNAHLFLKSILIDICCCVCAKRGWTNQCAIYNP